jgi:hypothetical protein
MTYLVNIGASGANANNVSGIGSRGYHVFRRGRTVVCRWAGVEVSAHRRFTWSRTPAEKSFTHHSEAEAKEFLRALIHAKTRPGVGYSRLPQGSSIRSRAPTSRKVSKHSATRPKSSDLSRITSNGSIRRAISIRQPLVEQILRGIKTWEYRSQPTRIRERVFLYASLSPFDDARQWARVGKKPGALATGVIVGSVEIVDCRPTADGDFKYKLAAPRRLKRHLKPRNQPQPRFWIPEF